ncbi:hypothetical protein A1351_08555 [Methylosinus sp. R-45379]|uniref:tape measure protein n=1 Tax=Methylosinus sp. R-45379 TaxID=980563 RepID=UPI0007D75DEB|nr:tape measure protein [Methylosinus sp. R-45379]OAI30542.1 hypothetical protein A1351_08555 [Methylosinus sp. R-45379]
MAEHSIQISVDASAGRAELRSLTQAIQSTSNALRQLGSAGGGNAFASLSRSLTDTSRGFESLKRATRDNGLAEFNQSISALSRGMPVAAREIVALASAFIVNRNAVALFAGALGTVGLGKFASDSMTAGTAALNLKIAVDSVAAGSGEAGRALAFIRQTAQDLGQPLDVATKQFASFYTSARALGKTPQTIENVWRGLSTAMSALHVGRQDQALFFKELQETYAMNKIDATRLVRSMSTHLPGLTASMSQALGITGAEMHHRFKNGGLSVDSWEALASLLEKRYGGGVKEALDHAQGSVIALSNSFELLKQKTFDSGIDAAIAGVANTVNSILKPNIDSIAGALGTAFQHGSAGVQLLMTKLYELRSPLTTIGTILAGYAAYQATFAILAAGVSFLLRPIGLAVAAGALLYATWESFEPTAQKLAAIFQHLGQGVANLSALIADSTKGFINFGAVAAWAGEKASSAWSWLTGGVDKLANNAGYKAGTDYLSGISAAASGLTRKLWGGIESSIPDFLKPTKLVDDYKRLLDATRPKEFTQHGDYESNRKIYDAPHNDLSEEQTKLLAKLSPTTAALKTYREELEKIAGLRGKIDPLSGSLIGDAEISKLREAAREQAFVHAFPAANKISELVDKIRLEKEALANAGGLSNKEALQQEREFLQIKLSLKKRHVDLTHEETAALRDLIRAEHELAKGGSNGFSQWANQQKTSVEAMNDNIRSGLDSLADGIAKVAVEGKGKFSSLGAAIRSEFADIAKSIASNFLKAGIRDLMAKGIKSLNLDSSLTSTLSKAIGGGQDIIDKANNQLDKFSTSDALKTVGTMDVQAAVVNLNASGLDAFKPGSTLQDSINPKAVGGVEPKTSNLQKPSPLAEQIGVKPLADSGAIRTLDGISRNSAESLALRMSTRPGTDMVHVNDKLKDILDNASKSLPEGWRAQYTSGFRHTGAINPNSLHDRGLATDVQLFDANGKALANYQNAGTFRDYEKFAQAAKRYQTERYPDLNDRFAWGGYYGGRGGRALGYGGADTMHFDLGGKRGRMGNWDDGLTAGRGLYDTQDKPSIGMRKLTEGRSAFDDTARESVLERQMREQREKERESRTRSDSSADIGRQSNSTANDLAGLGTSIAKLGASGKATAPAIVSVAESVLKLLSDLASGGKGGGSGGGGLGSIVSAGASLLGSFFQEGGMVGAPVSSTAMPASFWAGAPHYAEGTPNTSGGHPAILHDNEAVIPLTRGREVPVQLNGAGGGGDTHVTYNMHSNITAKDHDSFRRNSGQIAAEFHKVAGRMAARNN